MMLVEAHVKRGVPWEVLGERIGCQLCVGRLLLFTHRGGYEQRT